MRTKNYLFLLVLVLMSISFTACSQNTRNTNTTVKNTKVMKKQLTKEEERVIIHKGTEMPFTGEYTDNFEEGTYVCKQCGSELYTSSSKFHSGCGWPSFDQEIPGKVKKLLDADGRRTEIVCATCDGHLGHVFYGEGFTAKDTRHCVNSISMEFVPKKAEKEQKTEIAIFAGGCFWGVEYYFKKLSGVLKTEVGYTGGEKENPTYHEVCQKNTGHFEAIRVIFDPMVLNYEKLVKYFFEIHDPTQKDGQGPDLGPQYLSAIFYFNGEQKLVAENVVSLLENMGKKIATHILPVKPFWSGEDFHQNYYEKMNKTPYCHAYKKIFKD